MMPIAEIVEYQLAVAHRWIEEGLLAAVTRDAA